MYEPDQEKKTFITNRGLCCYKTIPSGLKNVDATYQCLKDKIFKEKIGCTMEVYVAIDSNEMGVKV